MSVLVCFNSAIIGSVNSRREKKKLLWLTVWRFILETASHGLWLRRNTWIWERMCWKITWWPRRKLLPEKNKHIKFQLVVKMSSKTLQQNMCEMILSSQWKENGTIIKHSLSWICKAASASKCGSKNSILSILKIKIHLQIC